MKLASLKGGRDGALVVVSDDLRRQADAKDIAPNLQRALENWSEVAPRLEDLSEKLSANKIEARDFAAVDCSAPLPRAYQWIDGSAYVNHVELVRKARGATLPESFWTDPLVYQGGSDTFLGPCEPILLGSEDWGCDCEAEVAVIVDDVPLGVDVNDAHQHIKLVLLVNDVSLRNLIPAELAKGFGFFQSKPSSAFSPVAVTPNDLGEAWKDGKLHLPLLTEINGELLGKPNAGVDMTFNFAQLITHAAKTRALSAGTIIGSGTVSNRDSDGSPGHSVKDGGVGYSCLAELRSVETIRGGKAQTPFLRYGDRVRIEMKDEKGHSIFGAIDQTVSQ